MLEKQSHTILEYPLFRISIFYLYIFYFIFIYLLVLLLLLLSSLLPDWHAETNYHAQAIKCVCLNTCTCFLNSDLT